MDLPIYLYTKIVSNINIEFLMICGGIQILSNQLCARVSLAGSTRSVLLFY